MAGSSWDTLGIYHVYIVWGIWQRIKKWAMFLGFGVGTDTVWHFSWRCGQWDWVQSQQFAGDIKLCGAVTCWRLGIASRETWKGRRGLCKPHGAQQGQGQGPALGLGQFLVHEWARQRIDWGQPCQEGLGGWWMGSWTWPSNVHFQPRKAGPSWAACSERAWSHRTKWSGFKLTDRKLKLDIRKKIFSVRLVKPWQRLSREAELPHPWKCWRPGGMSNQL